MTVGFVGLGSMGLGMARNLARAAADPEARSRHNDRVGESLRAILACTAEAIAAAGVERTCFGDYAGLRVRPRPREVPPTQAAATPSPEPTIPTAPERLFVWNRTESGAMTEAQIDAKRGEVDRRYRKVEEVGGERVHRAEDLNHLAAECDVVCLCVNEAEDVQTCLRELTRLPPRTLVIDHTTISPREAEACAELAGSHGLRYVDAPVTGGQSGAENGSLTTFFGGAEPDVKEAMAICAAYSTRQEWVGERVGDGQKMKMANQISIAGTMLGFAESLAYAEKAGLDVSKAIRCIESGAGGSWVFTWYGPDLADAINTGEWPARFSIANHLKDCGCVIRSAEEAGLSVPLTQLCASLLDQFPPEVRHQANIRLYELLLRGEIEEPPLETPSTM